MTSIQHILTSSTDFFNSLLQSIVTKQSTMADLTQATEVFVRKLGQDILTEVLEQAEFVIIAVVTTTYNSSKSVTRMQCVLLHYVNGAAVIFVSSLMKRGDRMMDLNEMPDIETMTNPARHAKKIALKHFEQALAADEKHFRMELIDDGTVEVTDILSGCSRNVNVELDNVPAMILDILKQAGDWIL